MKGDRIPPKGGSSTAPAEGKYRYRVYVQDGHKMRVWLVDKSMYDRLIAQGMDPFRPILDFVNTLQTDVLDFQI